MSNAKIGIGSIEIHNKNFKDKEEAVKYAKRLQNYIYNYCKKNKCLGQAIIGVSNNVGEVCSINYISNGNVGRPKREIKISKDRDNYYQGNYIREWHLHILIVSSPSYSFRESIKEYIDKNWGQAVAYKSVCNIMFIDYIIRQSQEVIFCDYNYSSEDNLLYTLKQYYYEYLKINSMVYSKRLNNEDKYMKIRNYFIDLFPYNKVQKN